MIGSNLYTEDSKGKTRFWRMEQAGASFRTVSGILDGKAVESAWTECFPKNVGRANATTAEEQCTAEILALYKKKLDKKYYTQADFDAKGDEAKGYKFKGPMLAVKYSKYPGGTVISQPKLDGMRATAEKDVGLLSRQGKPYYHQHIMDALKGIFDNFPGIVLDGELYNHELKDDFNSLSSLIRSEKRTPEEQEQINNTVQYHIYDVMMDGVAFCDRLAVVESLISFIDPDGPIRLVESTSVYDEDYLNTLYAEYMEDGYEGQMVRLPHSQYEGNGKRSKGLLKRKEFKDGEFRIAELIEGKGNWAGKIKAVRFFMPDGRKTESGENPKAGCRGKEAFLAEVLQNPDRYKYVTIRYFLETPAGIPRFGVVVAWHVDLDNRG